MNWSGVDEFIDMGGDGLYVWASFLVVLGGVLWEAVLLTQRRRRARASVREHLPPAGRREEG